MLCYKPLDKHKIPTYTNIHHADQLITEVIYALSIKTLLKGVQITMVMRFSLPILVKKPLPPKPIAIKKPVVADDTKSVFGKAPSPQKKTKQAFSDEDADSTGPSALRQIVQTVLRRMESIFGVEE